MPAVDTDAAADTGVGTLRVGYYANDMAATLTQTITGPDGVTAETDQDTFGLDATGRINQITTSSNGAEKTKETYEFNDDSDSPAAISTVTDATGSSGNRSAEDEPAEARRASGGSPCRGATNTRC